MTTYTFRPVSSTHSYDWNDPASWAGGVVPNSPDADVVIPTTATLSDGSIYSSTITIAAGETDLVRSLRIENNSLVVPGMLTVSGLLSTGSNGSVGVSNGTLSAGAIATNSGSVGGNGSIFANTIVNGSSIGGGDLTVQTGSLSNTGTLGGSSGRTTVQVPPGQFSSFADGVLTGGRYAAGYGGTLALNVGGPVITDAADIALDSGGILESYDPVSGQYIPLRTTLRTIASPGTLTLSNGSYAFGPLTVQGAVTLADASTHLSSSQLTIAPGGLINGLDGSIDSPVDNEGTIKSGTFPDTSYRHRYTLVLNGAVSGNGTLEIAPGERLFGRSAEFSTTSILEIGAAVSASQTVKFDTEVGKLILDQPSSFAGTIATTGYGNQIIVKGVSRDAITATSYQGNASGGTLTLQGAGGPLALHFAGNLSAASFTLTATDQTLPSDPSDLIITVSGPAAQPPTAAGTVSAEVGLLYETVLGRAADAGGLAHYVMQATQQGVTLADEAANMAGSAEATGRYGSQTDTAFVQQLFTNAYGSAATSADNAGLANALVGELGRGSLSRGEVAVGVALGQQHRQIAGVDLSDGLIVPGVTGTVTADPMSPAGIAELIALTVRGYPLSSPDLNVYAQFSASGTSPTSLAGAIIGNNVVFENRTDFINSLYAHAFGRTPDAGGLAHYRDSRMSQEEIAVEIAFSPEHLADVHDALDQGLYVPDPTTSGLARLYHAILGRAPDLFGLTAERHRLDGGQTLADKAASMLGSPEYAARYGTLNDQAFITDLYQNALGRAPDPGGLNGYTAKLAGGATRAAVAFEIAESAEATLHLAPEIENGFVAT